VALTTYAGLVAALPNWLHNSRLTAEIPDLIALAEEQINADLADMPFLQRSPTPIALALGASSLTLPADTMRLISARLVEHDTPIAIKTMGELQRCASTYSEATGAPRICAVSTSAAAGTLGLTVYPTADAAYTVQVLIAAAIPALTVSNTTNFILTRAPSLYLYGTLLAAEPRLVNDQRIATWQSRYDQALARFKGLGWDGDAMLSTDMGRGRSTIFEG
jgi:hypothetical protein